MNHTRIAAEAIRYRLDLVKAPLVHLTDVELEQMAATTVAAADPTVDAAIRRIGTAWTQAGMDPVGLGRVWNCPEVRSLFRENPDLVDALDDIVRVATQSAAA